MKITIHNYEAFLLDYSEGTLTESQTQELQFFLSKHPELGILLEDLDMPVLEQESVMSDFTDELLKFQTPDQEEICRYLEGLMDQQEKTHFEKRLVAEPVLRSELEAFRKTILQAEKTTFELKSSLLREHDPVLDNVDIAYVEGLL